MVFVCPTKEDTEAITQMASKVKDTLKQIDNKLNVGVKPICVPCCVPLCEYPPPPAEPKNNLRTSDFDPPEVMVCYKEVCPKAKGRQKTAEPEKGVIRLHQSKSRELRASILYTGCLCEKRDGLQDDCPRTGCHGSPECLTSPPTCGPSEFCDGKHLGKKNTYDYLRKSGNASKNGNGESNGSNGNGARYKCFAATVELPIVIPVPPNSICCPCPPCL